MKLSLTTRALAVTVVALCAFSAQAASKSKPVTAATSAPVVVDAAQETSALFFSTCADSMGQEAEFNKRVQGLATAKTAVKMEPAKLAGMVNDKEAQNAWGIKGFMDTKKPLLLTYNKEDNICSLHVADIEPVHMRHAFQADLKQFVDLKKAAVKVYKPQTNGDVTAYGADLTMDGKALQVGIAINAKTGEEFLTAHMQ